MKKQTINLILASAMMAAFSANAADDFASKLPDLSDNPNKPNVENVKSTKTSSQVTANQEEMNLPPLPNIPEITREDVKRKMFEQAKDAIAPMTPEQVILFRKFIDEQQRAKSTTASPPAKPVVSTLKVSTDPGVVPPVVRLSGGFVSSLVFVDSTGAEWPVLKAYPANADVFHVEQVEPLSNVITVSTISAYAHGNLVVHLKGQTTPIMITLVSGQKEVDYRADFHIQKRGPNAVAPVAAKNFSVTASASLMNVLDGIPPPNSKPLMLGEQANMAWRSEGNTYIRTRMTLLSPGWIEHVVSPDGMHAYQIPESPVLIFSNSNGETTQVQIKEPSWKATIQTMK